MYSLNNTLMFKIIVRSFHEHVRSCKDLNINFLISDDKLFFGGGGMQRPCFIFDLGSMR